MILKMILYFRFCFQTKGFSFPAKSIIKEFLKIHLLFILLLPESCSPCVISVINIFLDFQLIIVKCFTAMFFSRFYGNHSRMSLHLNEADAPYKIFNIWQMISFISYKISQVVSRYFRMQPCQHNGCIITIWRFHMLEE